MSPFSFSLSYHDLRTCNKYRGLCTQLCALFCLCILWCIAYYVYLEWCMYSNGELFMRPREGYFGVYFPSCAATREINTKMTLEWAHKQFVTRVHTSFYFSHDIRNTQMTTKTTIFSHQHRVSLVLFTFYWWRHNWLLMTSQWPDNCDLITLLVIINSLDTDFILGDIHGRSCEIMWLIHPFLRLLKCQSGFPGGYE